jgi:hypothetical protein
MIPLILATVLNTTVPTYTEYPTTIHWAPISEGAIYELQFSLKDRGDFQYLQYSYWPTTNTYQYITYIEDGYYCTRLRYRIEQDSEYLYKFLECFNFKYNYTPQPEEEPQEEVEEILKEQQPPTEEEKEVPEVKAIPKIHLEKEIRNRDTPLVLGISESKPEICKISILKESKYKILQFDCDTQLNITKAQKYDFNSYSSLLVEGTYREILPAQILIYECTPFNLLDISTWGKCNPRLIQKIKKDISPIYTTYISLNGKQLKNRAFGFRKDRFYISTDTSENIQRTELILKMYISFKTDRWVDIDHSVKKDITFEKVLNSSKPFSFPLDRYIGATQWYGCTQYQCPHKGIDFGARLNKVLSVGDGTVVKVGYDKYGGECNQGGNFVIIKHTNGMYSTYFHLDSYTVKVGDLVKKNQVLGISGNSGKWNCQNLGYHLHFETRKSLPSSTHTNPVEHIEVDWNMIPTIGKDIYPARLTGENPHPNF